MKLRLTLVLFLAVAAPLFAQEKPNSMGVSFHHISFVVSDYDANVDFWTKFGATPQARKGNARFSIFTFAGADVNLTVSENKSSAGGSVGSVVDHIGFLVPDVPPAAEKWKAAGLRVDPGSRVQQVFLYTPDNVKIEILQDATLKVPIRPGHVHFFTPAPEDMEAWYGKMFGVVPAGKRGSFLIADLPDMELAFSKAAGNVAPTKGRALDHIGIAVENLDEAKKRLEAGGVKFDPAQQPAGGRGPATSRIAFFTDPWGVQVELIQVNAGSGK